jgi:CRP/FNR family transcriptional regulator, nitrogen fixation regulation protein
MQTQTAIRSDAFRVVSTSRPFPPTPRPAGRPAYGSRGEANSLDESLQLMGATMSYPRNTEIFGENEPADYVYKVVSGSVRTYNILSDGRRQIGGFYMPGDIFGIEFDGEHSSAAEAISDARVLVVKRSALDALAGRDASVARELYALTARELRRVQDRILLLIKSAQERVAGFLLEMAKRAAGGNAIELPMSRQDIADYLGLTIETVSRTLTSLETAAAIDVPTSRRIVLRDRSALSRMNG